MGSSAAGIIKKLIGKKKQKTKKNDANFQKVCLCEFCKMSSV